MSLDTMTKDFVEEHAAGPPRENSGTGVRFYDRRSAKGPEICNHRFDGLAYFLIAWQPVHGVPIECLEAVELHSVLSFSPRIDGQTHTRAAVLDRCTFAVDHVVVVRAGRQRDCALVDFGKFLEQRRICLQLVFPIPNIDVDRAQRKSCRLFGFSRHIGRCIFFVNLDRAICFYLNETFHRRFVLLIGFQPDNAAQRIDVVIDRHQDGISEVRPRVRAALASDLMCVVELIVAHSNVHIQKPRVIAIARSQGAMRCFNVDTAVFSNRVADEIR